jgi:molybdopterin/thiamine biosynthesis adenylyltransferase
MNSKKNIQSYGRFKGLPWFDKIAESMMFVGGAGGIGSWTTLFLARTGANVIVADMDTVEEHNIAGQTYGKTYIGKKKVDALSEMIDHMCGENNLTTLDEEITDQLGKWQSLVNRCQAVVVGFDNLTARKLVYEQWKAHGAEKSIFLDGRLSAESFTVYILTKESTEDDFKAYEETYFSEGEKADLPCTMKATTHCGAGIAWWITTQISNYLNNLTEGAMSRTLSNIEVHGALSMIDQPVLKPKKEEYANASIEVEHT